MDASAALSELVGLSTQVVEAVITGPGGAVEADARVRRGDARARSRRRVTSSSRAAAALRPDGPAVERVHVDLGRGSIVVVREGERTIVATTVPEPTAGLVAFDLRTALRRLGEGTA